MKQVIRMKIEIESYEHLLKVERALNHFVPVPTEFPCGDYHMWGDKKLFKDVVPVGVICEILKQEGTISRQYTINPFYFEETKSQQFWLHSDGSLKDFREGTVCEGKGDEITLNSLIEYVASSENIFKLWSSAEGMFVHMGGYSNTKSFSEADELKDILQKELQKVDKCIKLEKERDDLLKKIEEIEKEIEKFNSKEENTFTLK